MKTTTDEKETPPKKEQNWMVLLGILLLALAAIGLVAWQNKRKQDALEEEQWNQLSEDEKQEFLTKMNDENSKR
jgi:LPXTG-motif cell wall-anchored protein